MYIHPGLCWDRLQNFIKPVKVQPTIVQDDYKLKKSIENLYAQNRLSTICNVLENHCSGLTAPGMDEDAIKETVDKLNPPGNNEDDFNEQDYREASNSESLQLEVQDVIDGIKSLSDENRSVLTIDIEHILSDLGDKSNIGIVLDGSPMGVEVFSCVVRFVDKNGVLHQLLFYA